MLSEMAPVSAREGSAGGAAAAGQACVRLRVRIGRRMASRKSKR